MGKIDSSDNIANKTTDTISLQSRVRFRAVGEDGVIVNMDSGRVIVVNEVGLNIVKLLESPTTPSLLTDVISKEFEVTTDQARVDIDMFLSQLNQEHLLNGDNQTQAAKPNE